jgi:hypothetical protein
VLEEDKNTGRRGRKKEIQKEILTSFGFLLRPLRTFATSASGQVRFRPSNNIHPIKA